MSKGLTRRQEEVLGFLRSELRESGIVPTSREIQKHFGFSSQTAAMDHLRALERKGAIRRLPGKARAVMIMDDPPASIASFPPSGRLREIPLHGEIAAGMPVDTEVGAEGSIGIDATLVGLPEGANVFGLKVRGDSMIDAHIVQGDIVVMEMREPRNGEIVAALIDGETTLKRYLVRNGQPYLKAENPAYPELIPASELIIQGVQVGLLRGNSSMR